MNRGDNMRNKEIEIKLQKSLHSGPNALCNRECPWIQRNPQMFSEIGHRRIENETPYKSPKIDYPAHRGDD